MFAKKTLATIAVALTLGTLASPASAGPPVSLLHVHGLSYSADGNQLLIPSHLGLAVYADGHWSRAPGQSQDNMGFSATREALYSSGHPAVGSGLTNPFGLIKGRMHRLAVYPTDARIVAAGTDEGLYLSRNSADAFEPLARTKLVIAEHFDLDGQHLWFSSAADKPSLARIALKAGAKAEDIALPAPGEDAVLYIAQNPVRRGEIAIATYKRSVYLSKVQGRNWTQIAKGGIGLE
jgi:hypothetical protein